MFATTEQNQLGCFATVLWTCDFLKRPIVPTKTAMFIVFNYSVESTDFRYVYSISLLIEKHFKWFNCDAFYITVAYISSVHHL